jgi:hypothetical protein
MKGCFVTLFASGLLISTATSVPGATFDYTNPGLVINTTSDVQSQEGIQSTASTTGGQATGPLHIDGDGYGIRGNFNDELNYDETIVVEFSEAVILDSLLLTESNGGNNDLVVLLVDGNSYDFTTHFCNNHPEEMTARATSAATSFSGNPVELGWLLDFTGLGVAGETFTFAIPVEVQSQGSGGDYQIGGLVVRPVPEPASLLLGCVAVAALGAFFRRN